MLLWSKKSGLNPILHLTYSVMLILCVDNSVVCDNVKVVLGRHSNVVYTSCFQLYAPTFLLATKRDWQPTFI